jgi:hypothetical protein
MISKDFRQQLLTAVLDIADLYSEDISLYLGIVTFDNMVAAEE